MIGQENELRPLLAVHRELLSLALELAAAVEGGSGARKGGKENEGAVRASVQRVRGAGGGGVPGRDMEEAERAAGVLARALEAAKGGAGGSCGGALCPECHSKKRRCGVSVEDADEEKGHGTVAVVLGIPDVAQAIASHVEQEDVLAFALACKGFLAGVRNAGRRLQSPVGATLSTVARAKWALKPAPDRGLEVTNNRVCRTLASRGGADCLSVLEVAYERGFHVLSTDVMRAAARSGLVEVLDWAKDHRAEDHRHTEEVTPSRLGQAKKARSPAEGRVAINFATVMEATMGGGSLPAAEWVWERSGPSWRTTMQTEPTASQLFGAAAESGHKEAVAWLREKGLVWNWKVFPAAARGGHLALMRWAHEEQGLGFEAEASVAVGDLEDPQRKEKYTCETAAFAGRLDILQWAWDAGAPANWHIFRSAAAAGHIEIMEWAWDHDLEFESEDMLLALHEGAQLLYPGEMRSAIERTATAAAVAGHGEALIWALRRGCPMYDVFHVEDWLKGMGGGAGALQALRGTEFDGNLNLDSARMALSASSTHSIKFLRSFDPPCPWDARACHTAAAGGHLEALELLRSEDPPCPWDESVCAAAARTAGGRGLVALQWLRAQDPPCPWGEGTCSSAAAGGQIEALKWLRAQDPPCPWDESVCAAAARTGGRGLMALHWLRAQDPPCPWDEGTCSSAAAFGQIEALQWLRAQDPPCPWDSNTVLEAREGGWGEVEAWALEHGCPSEEIEEEG